MHIKQNRRAGWMLVLTPAILLITLVVSPKAQAQERLAGKYRCVQIETKGQIASCKSPPLTLNRDGSYQIWGERGTYEVVQDRWLVLSHSKRRGLGTFLGGQEIIFTYRIGRQDYRVTFRLLAEPPRGVRWS